MRKTVFKVVLLWQGFEREVVSTLNKRRRAVKPRQGCIKIFDNEEIVKAFVFNAVLKCDKHLRTCDE